MRSNHRLSRVGIAVALACGGTVGAPVAALAQSAGSRSDAGLEEIIVTARKTEEALQETPVAVTALTAEIIAERQIVDVNDVARFAPGLVFDKAFGRTTERPVIRGLGSVLAGTGFGVEAGAAYFVDGIYYPGDIQSLDMNEVQRVEVIRGPQSALYGRNTYSGAINFITRAPSDQLGVSARANWDDVEQGYSLRVEGPLFEKLTGSIAARYYDFDGQWTNGLTGETIGAEQSKNVSGVLDWTPTEDISVRLRASYTEDRDGTRPFMFQDSSFNNCYPGTRSLAYFATSGSRNSNQYFCGEIDPRPLAFNTTRPVTNPLQVPGYPSNAYAGPPIAGAPAGSTRTYDLRPGVAFSGVDRNLRYFSAIANWDIAGSGYVLTADGAIRGEDRRTGSDSDFTPLNVFTCDPAVCGRESSGANTNAEQVDDYSVEIKIASPTDRELRWMLGAFNYDQDLESRDVNFRYPTGWKNPVDVIDIMNTALFGLVEWQFLDAWSVTVEGRYMEETKAGYNFCTAASATCTRPDNDFANGPGQQLAFSGKRTWYSFTPRATLKWQITPDLNAYAIYAEGVKPGGFNGSGGVTTGQTTFDPETSENYELGLKSMWLGGRLMVNLAAYFTDATDIQLTTPIYRTDGSAITSLVTNQGSGEVKGLEVEARWRVLDPLTLGLTYARADTEFTEGCDDFQWTLSSGGGNSAGRPGAYNPANPAAGGTNLSGNGDCSIKGAPFPMSAKDTASFSIDYSAPFWDEYEFFVNTDVSYVGARPVQVHDDPYVPSATLVGARIGISTDRWSAAIYGRNLTDEDSVAVATRWFTQYVAISQTPIPGTTPMATRAQLQAAGLPVYPPQSGVPATGLNSVASYTLPRAFFAMLRRERQIGLEVSYKF